MIIEIPLRGIHIEEFCKRDDVRREVQRRIGEEIIRCPPCTAEEAMRGMQKYLDSQRGKSNSFDNAQGWQTQGEQQ